MDMSTTTFGVVVIQSAAVLLRRFSVRTVTVHGSMVDDRSWYRTQT